MGHVGASVHGYFCIKNTMKGIAHRRVLEELEYVILTKRCQHINEMMAVAVKHFLIILWSRFLIIRQIFNMATNAISVVFPLQRGQLSRDREGSTSRPLTNLTRASLTWMALHTVDQSHARFTDMHGAS